MATLLRRRDRPMALRSQALSPAGPALRSADPHSFRFRGVGAALGGRRTSAVGWIRLLLLLVQLPLQAGAPASAGPLPSAPSPSGPWLFRCRITGEQPQLFRIDPRLGQVQLLDPTTRQVERTIETDEPPPELGRGIIDDSVVTIDARQVSWEETMYRPQFARESRSIDLKTLVFRSTSSLQIDGGPDVAEQKTQGSCERLDGSPGG